MNSYFTERSKCPCCESPECTVLCRAPYSEAPLRDYLVSFYSAQGTIDLEYLDRQDYVLVECLACGTIYQLEVPDEFLMHILYEEWIDPEKAWELRESRRSLGYFSALSKEIADLIRYFDRPPSQLTFLDYGMGWGHWCRMAQAFGCTVYGVELSEARIKHARQIGLSVIDYEEISTLQFDFINTEQVFEHLSNPRETISHLRQSLTPGGLLKISVPDGSDIRWRLSKGIWQAPKTSPYSLNPVAPLEHINCFNRTSLLRLAKEFSLEPVDFQVNRDMVETVRRFIRSTRHQLNRLRRIHSRPGVKSLRLYFKDSRH